VALAAIAEETKISVALLEGLERDDLSRWPGGLFRRAYVRTYAQKIGLDPEQLLREFLATYPDPVEETSPVEAIAQNSGAGGKRPRMRIGFLIAGLAGLRPPRSDATRRLVTSEVREPVNSQPSVSDPTAAEPAVPEPMVSLSVAPDPVPQPDTAPQEEAESALRPPARMLTVPSDDVPERRRESRTLERHIGSVARLCTRIARAIDGQDLAAALDETVDVLAAQGAILWVWDLDRDALFPALASGYADELLSKLPDVSRGDDNAIAAAFCSGQKQIVRGIADDTGALVMPLLTPAGCPGVLALEFANGGEEHDLCQSLAAIITAQLSTLFAIAPQAELDEEWESNRSLVAS
jgi:hypothetical protein